MFLSWLDWDCSFFGRKAKGKVTFSSHHVKGKYYQHDLPWLMSIFITWLSSVSQVSPL